MKPKVTYHGDDAAAALVLELISQLRAEQGCAVVLVTHSRSAASICDRQLRLDGGQLRAVEEAATGRS